MLYVVGTPIGNLEDISFRAVRILKEVEYIFAEDTRVTRKLLDHYEIKNTIYQYHEHNKMHQIPNIINLLKEDKDIAIVTDAGMPLWCKSRWKAWIVVDYFQMSPGL